MAELPPIDQHLEKEHQEKTKVKNIQCVEMGKFEVKSVSTTPAANNQDAAAMLLELSEASLLLMRENAHQP